MRVVFMGTPDFAVFSLKALCENGYTPVAVISQTDKPRGRGNKLSPTPVKVYAESLGILYKKIFNAITFVNFGKFTCMVMV